MNYYPRDKCFLCSSPMHQASPWLSYCSAPGCFYEVKKHSFVFSLKVNNQEYDVNIYDEDNVTVIDRKTISKVNFGEVTYDIIYEVEEVLEMTVGQWIEFIQRIERLNAFK